ncbi:cell division protein ZapE [Tabrizicola sp. WMC-M-20]|nr:cell division protein ZapE [Tabrizicola sp. WMC-M-20]
MTNTLTQIYEDRATAGLIRPDAAQRAVLPQLEALRQSLSDPMAARGILGRIIPRRRTEAPAGLYLWGDVGRGKSMLMDLFFSSVAATGKQRLHFHAFLLGIHAAIHSAHRIGSRDPIAEAIDQSTRGMSLLALDEMDVSDIGDAMLVDRVFRHLLDQGVCIVSTSNRPPADLYRNGLKRELFLPFIALLESRLQVVELAGPTDWRRGGQTGAQVFFGTGDQGFDDLWRRLVAGPVQPLCLDLLGRQIVLPQGSGRIARATFADLCESPLGPADHGAIARAVDILFLDSVPQLGLSARDDARRFVTLIDELYEAGTGLALSSAAPPDALFSAEIQSEGTNRLLSRLAEMQSARWVGRTKLARPLVS